MFGGKRKTPVHCPHCGAEQLEPAAVISTYCRTCSGHIRVQNDPPPPEVSRITQARRAAWRALSSIVQKTVVCHGCGATHRVPAGALSSQCPHCGSHMNLADVIVETRSSQTINTSGTLRVTSTGFLNNVISKCGRAIIEGRIAGRLQAEHSIEIHSQGRCDTELIAPVIRIGRRARMEVTRYIATQRLEVEGHVEAKVLCDGPVIVRRKGALLGDVIARAVTVDKGGIFSGEFRIQQKWPEEWQKWRDRENSATVIGWKVLEN